MVSLDNFLFTFYLLSILASLASVLFLARELAPAEKIKIEILVASSSRAGREHTEAGYSVNLPPNAAGTDAPGASIVVYFAAKRRSDSEG